MAFSAGTARAVTGLSPVALAQQTTPPPQTATPTPAQGRGAAPAQPDRRGGPGRGGPNGQNRLLEWEWWKDDEVKRDLGLSDKVAADIDTYYQQRLRQMMPFAEGFNHELDTLNQMSSERKVDDWTYAVQVAKVEAFSSKLRESRTIMLYHIARKLTPEQVTKLEAARDRHFQRGRGGH